MKGENVDADELAEDAEADVQEKERNKVGQNYGCTGYWIGRILSGHFFLPDIRCPAE